MAAGCLGGGRAFSPDGAAHENTLRARKFARQLQGRFKLPVFEVDERYTTTEALSMGAKTPMRPQPASFLNSF